MQTQSSRPQATTRKPTPERGAPPTYATSVTRKGVSVRVSVRQMADADEIREHGYGHGV